MSNEQEMREAFEKVHCNNNKHITRRNERGDYVLPSIQDAYSGWQAATLAAEARIRDLEAKAGAPKGWKLVPIIPTQTMCVLGNEKAEEWRKFPLRISSIWKTMLEAAPIPPTVEKMAEKPSSYCTVNKADKSTCQLHNLQCAYPSCIDAALSEHKENQG